MDPKNLIQRLSDHRGYGKTAPEVLTTAALVSEADSAWGPQAIQQFQTEAEMHPKVWEKLCSIARDARLKQVPVESLPGTYTALYALVVLSDEEWGRAQQEGIIRPSASSRSFLEWTRQQRLQKQGYRFEQVLRLIHSKELRTEEQSLLIKGISEVAAAYGVSVLTGDDGTKQRGVVSEKRRGAAEDLEAELIKLLSPVFDDASSPLKEQFHLQSVADLVNGELRTFTGFLVRHYGSTEGMWDSAGREYCLKVALEFNRTESRAQRHNYKKRLEKVQVDHPACSDTVQEVLTKFLN
jgi:histidinol phosphatase-like enzyme